jgi:hypothetical protein
MILNVSAYMSPVKLPPSSLGNIVAESVIVSGWGKTSDSKYIVLSFIFKNYINGLDSSVCVATGYGLDGPGIESRWG